MIDPLLTPGGPIRPVRADREAFPTTSQRQTISLEKAKELVASILDPREKAIMVTLLKTGILRHELSELDVGDVDIANNTIMLKSARKRSNHTLYFDDECAYILNR